MSKLYTKYQISEMMDIPIYYIEWCIKGDLIVVKKRDRKGNMLIPDDQIQQIYDLYSSRYSYLSDDEFDKLVHGQC